MCSITLDLPGTKTHAERRCHWSPRPAATVGDVLGVATVVCGRSSKNVASYEVSERPYPHGRAFEFKKVAVDRRLAADEQVTYTANLAPDGQNNRCDCDGFAYGHGRPCRHITVGLQLLHEGHLDPMADAPVSEYPSPEQVRDDAGKDLPDCFKNLGPSSVPSSCPF